MNVNLKNKIIELTKALAVDNDSYHKHFSFICKNSRILAIGVNNQRNTHPLNKFFKYRSENRHSEMDAYIKLRWRKDIDWNKIILVNTRINVFGLFGQSRPCEGCDRLIKSIGIKHVYFTDKINTPENKIVFEKL